MAKLNQIKPNMTGFFYFFPPPAGSWRQMQTAGRILSHARCVIPIANGLDAV
jgi:hypothetical protein